jgi:hypothetical protein
MDSWGLGFISNLVPSEYKLEAMPPALSKQCNDLTEFSEFASIRSLIWGELNSNEQNPMCLLCVVLHAKRE